MRKYIAAVAIMFFSVLSVACFNKIEQQQNLNQQRQMQQDQAEKWANAQRVVPKGMTLSEVTEWVSYIPQYGKPLPSWYKKLDEKMTRSMYGDKKI